MTADAPGDEAFETAHIAASLPPVNHERSGALQRENFGVTEGL